MYLPEILEIADPNEAMFGTYWTTKASTGHLN
jgi:hypothetical protein